MILLDTNALIWLHRGHPRGRPLQRHAGQLHVSPASLLELQLLFEVGRVRLRAGGTVSELLHDERWAIDDPPAGDWFAHALDLAWTRDPFDRLLVAHAVLRGWRVATGDSALIDRLGPRGSLEL